MIPIPQWLRELDPELLPEQHKKLADVIGYDKMLELVAVYSGDYLYVPKLDAIVKSVRDKRLLADHEGGMQPPELAHKYDLSVVQVYEIIKRARIAQRIDRNQCSLFDRDAI